MAIDVYAPATFQTASVTAVLRDHGLDAEARPLSEHAVRPAEEAILIFPAPGVVPLGEHVSWLRRSLGPRASLLVLSPALTEKDRAIVKECGASALVTPRAWSPDDVAERLLGAITAKGDEHTYGGLRGGTRAMRSLYRDIATVAPLSDPVLILGETGTGKELVAAEVHARSKRPGPWSPLNCAAFAQELLESELFGHEKGAFSGATQHRRGLLADAGQSTVFLDEIGDLPLTAQAKLLRVLEEHKARAVGSNKWHPVEARVVLATNVDLERACEQGTFRRDLYERVSGFTLRIPPLRERRADIPLLVQCFLDAFNREHNVTRRVPEGALDCLFEHEWPGNVRELQKTVRRAAAYADERSGLISVIQLHEAARRRKDTPSRYPLSFDPAADTWRVVHDRVRDRYFRAVLAAAGGNKDVAAKQAGISRSQFYDIMKQIAGAEGERRG